MRGDGRVEAARAEIARRKALAEAATPGPWWDDEHIGGDGAVVMGEDFRRIHCPAAFPTARPFADAAHVAANDPTHVLAVLASAERTLVRHTGGHDCVGVGWTAHRPCPDATAVLDIYVSASLPVVAGEFPVGLAGEQDGPR